MSLKQALPDLPEDYAKDVKEFAVERQPAPSVPKMSIVIMIVGSRGDVQPYLALAKKLLEHGHRVRLATHETFRSFVKEAGVEFFSIGGDPKDLMSYMVKSTPPKSLTQVDMLIRYYHRPWSHAWFRIFDKWRHWS